MDDLPSVFSLRSVVDKPPIGGKELLPLTGHSLSGFRLNPGPVSIFIVSWCSVKANLVHKFINESTWQTDSPICCVLHPFSFRT